MIKDAKMKVVRAFIGTVKEAHEFTIDNEYIERGYRVNHDTFCKMLKSLCTCHNESVNVWSHMLGSFAYLLMIIIVCAMILPE